MINQPAERTQIDGLQDEYSLEAGIDCSDDPELVRQELAGEADINVLLAKFGIGIPQKQIVYGSQDFDLDLQTAYAAIDAVKNAWELMPDDIRNKYQTWNALALALDSGELKFDPTKPAGSQIITPDPKPEPEPKP